MLNYGRGQLTIGLASLPSRARTVSAPADKKASIPSAPGSESTAAAPGSEVAEESMGVLSQLAAKCCQLSLWMQLALFAAFLLLDSSRYFVDVRAMSPDPIIAQSVILYQDLLSVLLCLLAVWRYQGFRGLADTFSAVIDVAVRVVQSLMAGVLVKHWSTVAKADPRLTGPTGPRDGRYVHKGLVVQCLSMLVVFYLGLYMLALMVALGAFMYQLGRRQTKKRIQSQAEQPQEDTEDTEDIEAIRGLQRALSDPTDQRPARGLQRRRVTSDEALMPDNQALAPSEFEPLSPTQQLASFVPQMPPVERMQLLDRTWLEEERSRDSQFVAWISSKMGILIQLACVGVFVFFDSSRTIVNDQFINGTPIVSQSVTFAQFGASIVVGLLISVIAEGKAGLRAALSWKEILRCFPVAACFSLSQTFTIMAYSAAVSGMLNTVVGNLYLPLSALLSRWIFGRSYSFLEWLALTVLMLSASVFVLLQDSPKGDTPANIFSTGICYVLLSVCMSCLASMLSEKIMKAGSSHFYIQKVNLDVGSFATSVLMLWVCGVTSQRPQDAFWKERDVGGGKMEAGVFVGWDWRMMLVLVVTLLQNWLAGFVAKRLSTVIRSSAQQLSLLIVYFLGDIWLNHKTFDWPVGTTALAPWRATLVGVGVLFGFPFGTFCNNQLHDPPHLGMCENKGT
ncbi:unnamed protein product [Effrenium voratum]|nr:unnamed protein product [Effrenium voratum]